MRKLRLERHGHTGLNVDMSSVGRDAMQKPGMAGGPLFVVSMWRSGSSLLYALLNKHPQVALMYEADLVLLRPAFLKPKMFCDWVERWEFWNDALRRHGLAASNVPAGISDFPGAFSAVHRLYAKQRGATIWGDKSPNYYDRLNEMADDFPQARFILMWRDPKDTANSIVRAAALGNSYFSRKGAAHCGLLGYEVFKKECDRLVPRGKPVCQINYEDLIRETPAVMRQVCEFLQIPYDDSLSNLAGADRSAILEGQHHANLRGDTIVGGARPEIIGASLRAKISEYLTHWNRLYEVWPPFPQLAENAAQPPNGFSRFIDRGFYRVARLRDRISPVVFSFIPIAPLLRYRELKKRRSLTSSLAESAAVVSAFASPVLVTKPVAGQEFRNQASFLTRLRARASRTRMRAPLVWLRHRGLNSSDVFLASYSRSGNTMLRFMLGEALSGVPSSFDHIQRIAPEIGVQVKAYPVVPGGGRLIKTHEPYRSEYKRAIYLVRDVRDVMLSSFARENALDVVHVRTLGDYVSPFMEGKMTRLGPWQKHVDSWMNSPLAKSGDLLVLRFEELRNDPEKATARCLEFLGKKVEPSVIRAAVHNNLLDKMRAKEDQAKTLPKSPGEQGRWVGKGAIQGWREKLTEQHLEVVYEYAGDMLARLEYPVAEG